VTGASSGVTMNGSYNTTTPGTGSGSGSAAGATGSQLTNMGVPGSPATSGLFNSSSSKTQHHLYRAFVIIL